MRATTHLLVLGWLLVSTVARADLLPSFGHQVNYASKADNFKPSSSRGSASKESILADVLEKNGYGEGQYTILSSVKSPATDITYYSVRPLHEGLPVANVNMGIGIDDSGHISSLSVPVSPNTKPLSGQCRINLRSAESRVSSPGNEHQSTDPHQAIKSFLEYVNRPDLQPTDGSLKASQPDKAATSSRRSAGLTDEGSATAAVAFTTADDSLDGLNEGIEAVEPVALLTETGDYATGYLVKANFDDNVVRAHLVDGEVVGLNNLCTSLRYRAVAPNTLMDPTQDNRQLLAEPEWSAGAENGWNHIQGQFYNETRGNNVIVQANPTGKGSWVDITRPTAHSNGDFDYPINFHADPTTYAAASIVQAHYWGNMMHDFSKNFGFDNQAGNFEDVNEAGGKGNDPVIIYVQDGSGFNNANFATPEDGKQPKMRLYLWDKTNPHRDGAFDWPSLVHEYTHGITTRITGGPADSTCLSKGQAAGMGEGWSDFVALAWLVHPSDYQGPGGKADKVLGIGTYGNNGRTVRPHMYSTDMSVNPLTFSHLAQAKYQTVHAMGTLWATILYEVMWNFIADLGVAPSIMHPDRQYGTTLMMEIMFESWRRQGCDPTLFRARDAMLEAEAIVSKGKYQCLIWRGFAKRGMGVGASMKGTNVVESFKAPTEC
ncbi:hypothetical protein IWQ60_006272 [Tieghemiomyces parasiticus]|uniref:Extracellular metalloproteinase n=1 Tax=Tieghemiomyces parasiticus TaxID=78921 RepID=A0A9W8DXH8_9FUNG|nr:hypothetical protein IWQ60_006272 [Tieghemiomyces parasiticus]